MSNMKNDLTIEELPIAELIYKQTQKFVSSLQCDKRQEDFYNVKRNVLAEIEFLINKIKTKEFLTIINKFTTILYAFELYITTKNELDYNVYIFDENLQKLNTYIQQYLYDYDKYIMQQNNIINNLNNIINKIETEKDHYEKRKHIKNAKDVLIYYNDRNDDYKHISDWLELEYNLLDAKIGKDNINVYIAITMFISIVIFLILTCNK